MGEENANDAADWVMGNTEMPRGEKYLLLAYAHLSEDGFSSIKVPVKRAARLTGYSERQARLLTASLEKMGLLVRCGQLPCGTIEWRINSEWRSESARKKRASPKGPGKIYLMIADGLYKIGFSADPERRATQVRGPDGSVASLVSCKSVGDMLSSEKLLHSKFSKKRVFGEWFRLSRGEADSLATEMACDG